MKHVSFAIAFVALILSLFAVVFLTEQRIEMDRTNEELKELREFLTTKYACEETLEPGQKCVPIFLPVAEE